MHPSSTFTLHVTIPGESLRQQQRHRSETTHYTPEFPPYSVTQLIIIKDMAGVAQKQVLASLKGYVQSQHHTLLVCCCVAVILTRFQLPQIRRLL